MNAVTVTTTAASISPLALFLHADLVVKIVMLGLIGASLWTWTIILGRARGLARLQREDEAYARDVAQAEDIDRFHRARGAELIPAARVFAAGVEEWRSSTKNARVDREGLRQRLATAISGAVAGEVDQLSAGLNVLATIGSVCPFVGLFGTVWGIMRSFSDIAASQNTSFGAVAPGIAEALFATALGLFAAIPAVIGYNRMTHRIDRIEAGLNRFGDRFHATLSRELDREG